MKLNFLSLLGASALALSLSACGEDKPAPAPKPETKTEAPKPAEPIKQAESTPAPAPTPAPAAAVEEVAKAVVNQAEEMKIPPAERGEKLFKKCVSCHNTEGDKKHKFGPNLNGIIGRTAGSADGYEKYSKDMIAFAQPWTEELVVQYLENPSSFLKEKTGNASAKSRMTFKLKSERARMDIAAYLTTLK